MINIDITGEVIKCTKDEVTNCYIIELKISAVAKNVIILDIPLNVGKFYNIKTVVKWNEINEKYEHLVTPTIIEVYKNENKSK